MHTARQFEEQLDRELLGDPAGPEQRQLLGSALLHWRGWLLGKAFRGWMHHALAAARLGLRARPLQAYSRLLGTLSPAV